MAEQENRVAKKLSGSPLSPDQPIWNAPGRSFALPSARYFVHSSVVMLAVTPTLAQSAWISSAARAKFGLYGRERSEAQRSIVVTLLSARIFLAASGSYLSDFTSLFHDHMVGGIRLSAGMAPASWKIALISASLSI